MLQLEGRLQNLEYNIFFIGEILPLQWKEDYALDLLKGD